MFKFKKIAAIVMTTAMLAGITACEDTAPVASGGSESGGPGSSASTAASTTTDPNENAATDEEVKDMDTGSYTPSGNAGVVKILATYDIEKDQKGKEQCMIFESEQYGGDINVEICGGDYAYYDRLAVLIGSDDSPDLLTGEAMAIPYAVKKNQFESLDGLIDLEDPIWQDMAQYAGRYDGKVYYIPHRLVTSFGLNYNRKTIEDAGFTDPYELYLKDEWTWDTWRQMMIEFCNLSDDNMGFFATDTIATAFCNTTGKSLISYKDGVATNNMGDADITRAVEFLAELGRNGLLYAGENHGNWVPPQTWATISDQLLFLGMEPEWTYIAATEEIQNKPGVDNDILNTVSDFAFVPFPRDPKADAYYLNNGTFGYMIAKGAKNVDGAVEFMYCNRIYETDQNIVDQIRADHVSPEPIYYTAGDYAGKQRWEIVWDEKVYDLWREVCTSDKFVFVPENLYGFGPELKQAVCETVYKSTFGGESWSQLSQEAIPIIDGVLDEY